MLLTGLTSDEGFVNINVMISKGDSMPRFKNINDPNYSKEALEAKKQKKQRQSTRVQMGQAGEIACAIDHRNSLNDEYILEISNANIWAPEGETGPIRVYFDVKKQIRIKITLIKTFIDSIISCTLIQ